MIFSFIKKNNYQDSINLMLLTNQINSISKIIKGQVMMATPANKEILKASGLYTQAVGEATPNDMAIVFEAEDDSALAMVEEKISSFLGDLSSKESSEKSKEVKSWDEAMKRLPDANVALFSIPGEYGAKEMEKALENGLHVFSFTDNISKADEIKLKKIAHEKGLLMMGPDCGTGIISGVPMAFTNVIRPGNIGIVGASGTGIQEVSCLIDRYGGGLVHAIGTGGRDLSEEVGGVTAIDALMALNQHDGTDVIVFITKPPAQKVRDRVMEVLHSLDKPVVAIFLGEKPTQHQGDVYLAHTLEECARLSVELALEAKIEDVNKELKVEEVKSDACVKGLYSGGTLGSEAAMLFSEALGFDGQTKHDGYLLKTNEVEIIDLGDDIYTQGRPHPMIDPTLRLEKIKEISQDGVTDVILFDCVLGYGTNEDMAKVLGHAIKEGRELALSKGKSLEFIGSVVGTDNDPMRYSAAVKILEESGAKIASSNASATRYVLKIMGIQQEEMEKAIAPFEKTKIELIVSKNIMELINTKPRVINIGLESFQKSLDDFGAKKVHFQWKPRAKGNKEMMEILDYLESDKEIEKSNLDVIERIKNSTPFLKDVVPAKEVIDILKGKVILHAGPPMEFSQMTGPMKGSCIGAVLFEGWAKTEEEALKMLEGGQVEFHPCHHFNAVGPMGGITTGNMPVLVVENAVGGNQAYCTMNEGIGKVLRFGAYSQEVIDRLTWMKDVLGPNISKALKQKEGGLNISVIIAKAITMGDEFHQRNIAASLLFLKEISPLILMGDGEKDNQLEVIQFLADTDQFFLNIMMAAGKSMVDYARKIEKGTVVTTMARNGYMFGIRIAGMGDEWFTAPVNTPKGLYFTGFEESDGSKDIGDSAITETVGVGGMAMIAAPGVTRFVGAGGFQDALNVSETMKEICIDHNSNWAIPTWDFKGACLGIDAVKVVDTSIEPIINTGIAHKEPGKGQIGAGTVTAPLECFEKALKSYYKKLTGEPK